MLFTTLKDVILPEIRKVVLETDTVAIIRLNYEKNLPILTSNTVLEQLERLPVLEIVREFHKCYTSNPADLENSKEVKWYYHEAGGAMLRSLELLDGLRRQVSQGVQPTRLNLQEPVMLITKCIDKWYRCIGSPEFQLGQDKRRAIRFRYLEHASAIIYALGKLAMPCDLQKWIDELGEQLETDEYEELLIMDSEITMAKHNAKFADVEVLLPPEMMLEAYVSNGTTELTPFLIANTESTGNRYVVNAKCVRTDPNLKPDYLNMGCLNPRWIKTLANVSENLSHQLGSSLYGLGGSGLGGLVAI